MRLFVLLGLLFFSVSARADLFLVERIHTDVTDKDATTAREKALTIAQEKAFSILLDNLILEEDKFKIGTPETAEILNLVEDFSVSEEKTSSVRYMADVNVHFDTKDVQDFLQSKSVPYLSLGAERHLILPVYTSYKKTRLWEENNPWREVWKNKTTTLVPLVLPLGDVDDMLVYSSQTLTDEDLTDLTPMLKRYEAEKALVLEASYYKDTAQIKVTVRPFKNEKSPLGSFSFMMPVENNHVTYALEQSAEKVQKLLVQKWKEANVVRTDNPEFLTAIVPIKDLKFWVRMQKRLKKVELIKKYDVKAVRRDQAQVEIFFVGDLKPFLEKLKDDGLFLAPSQNGLWSLRDISEVSQEEMDSLVIPELRKSIQFPIVGMESWKPISSVPVEKTDEGVLSEINEEGQSVSETFDDGFKEGFINRAIIWENVGE